jgi:hypothetical protein
MLHRWIFLSVLWEVYLILLAQYAGSGFPAQAMKNVPKKQYISRNVHRRAMVILVNARISRQ